MDIPRLRMFAGPNGSGKSTIKSVVPPELLGVYLNPDEMEKEIEERGFLDIRAYGVETTREEILPFFINSILLAKAELDEEAENLRFSDGKLDFFEVIVNAYFASVAADFIRQKLLEQRVSFSFETVMSSPDKVALLEKARSLGYRTYLYFIATPARWTCSCPPSAKATAPISSTTPATAASTYGWRRSRTAGTWKPYALQCRYGSSGPFGTRSRRPGDGMHTA